MLKRFKLWLYFFVMNRLLDDQLFITILYAKLQNEKNRLAEIELATRKLAEAAKIARAEAEQRANAEAYLKRKQKIQDNCLHLKGGKRRSVYEDYAIWDHTFSDGTRTVRCLLCSKEWEGEQLNSPEVMRMLNRTTNTVSSSQVEIGPNAIRDQAEPPKVIFFDSSNSEKHGNFSAEEPYAPFMSLKHWLKLDKIYKRLTRKKKKADAKN